MFQKREVAVLAQSEDDGVRAQFFELTSGYGESFVVEAHLLDRQVVTLEVADGREPTHGNALFERLFEFHVMGGHLFAASAIDNDRVGRIQTTSGACRIQRRVTAAVDHDSAPEQGNVVVGDLVKIGDGIENSRGVARGDRHAASQLGADAEEHGVEAALASLAFDVVHGVVESHVHAEIDDAVDLGVQHVARESVRGDAVAHHAAEFLARVNQVDLVAELPEMVGDA